MSLSKVKVYAKLVGIGLLLLFVVIFMASNRESVAVKFLGWQIWQAPLFVFIVAMATMGVVVFQVVRKIHKVYGDFMAMRREDKSRSRLVEQIKKEVKDDDVSN